MPRTERVRTPQRRAGSGGEPGERGALPPQRAPRTALGCAPVRGASGVGTEAPGDCSLPAVWRGQCAR